MVHRAVATKGAKRDWVLDADLKSAFDKIDHNFLLERLGTFPAEQSVSAGTNTSRVPDRRQPLSGQTEALTARATGFTTPPARTEGALDR
ncbi:hypothetical protein [Streptomyces sp. NPDC005799]|uniref:hypothetical protein n=1 Tax=Streptomyces sp. NPDC005799 TaxID=3154678 RepID=UPI0033E9319D